MGTIEQELTVPGASLSAAGTIKSEVLERVWFVAAEMEGPGFEGPGVGVWATNTDPMSSTSTAFISMNTQALASRWGDGTALEGGLASDDDGPDEAIAYIGVAAGS
jgi:hypothetical protein